MVEVSERPTNITAFVEAALPFVEGAVPFFPRKGTCRLMLTVNRLYLMEVASLSGQLRIVRTGKCTIEVDVGQRFRHECESSKLVIILLE